MSNNDSENASTSENALKLVLAWSLVGIPLVWGILQTLKNALKLFQ
jgi:hypothetical protein